MRVSVLLYEEDCCIVPFFKNAGDEIDRIPHTIRTHRHQPTSPKALSMSMIERYAGYVLPRCAAKGTNGHLSPLKIFDVFYRKITRRVAKVTDLLS